MGAGPQPFCPGLGVVVVKGSECTTLHSKHHFSNTRVILFSAKTNPAPMTLENLSSGAGLYVKGPPEARNTWLQLTDMSYVFSRNYDLRVDFPERGGETLELQQNKQYHFSEL